MLRRFLVIVSLAASLLASCAMFVMPASAQTLDTGIQAVAANTKLPSTDPRVIAVRIINVALGLLAIIMVSLIIYAGFLWMTSGGDAEKVGHAKKYIRNAIIGLVIILSAWAITTFVISRLLQALGGGGGTTETGPGGGGLGGGGVSSVFQVRSITPVGSIPLRNVDVRFLFTRDVNPSSAVNRIHVYRASDNSAVPGTFTTAGSLVTFVPTATCPDPNADRHCLDADTDYIAKADPQLVSASGQTLSCGGFGGACEARFHTGNLVDVSPPTGAITYPLDGQSVSVDDVIRVTTHATDDAGVSYVESFTNGTSIGTDAPATNTAVTAFDAGIDWDTKGLNLGAYTLQSRVHDLDANDSASQSIRVMVRPAFCFDGKQDGDETGLDCGGSCGACAGGSCQNNTDCASGMCINGKCVEQPTITSFSPPDGRPGTFVTIQGVNFGNTPGKVVFADNVVATAPTACANAGVDTWSDGQVIVQLPDGAKTGPIQITNVSSNLSDTTNDARGPKLNNFTVDASVHPGLCGVDPSHAQVGDQMHVIGGGLGSSPDKLVFDGREVTNFSSWNDTDVRLNVPVFSPGRYPVSARVSGADSNAVDFRIDEKTTTGVPIIDQIDPESGGVGQYITLTGRNFGTGIGSVVFKDPTTGETGTADVTFPVACAKDFWHDTSITVKVPRNIGNLGGVAVKAGTTYQVSVMRQDRVASAASSFQVTAAQPTPGICAIQPAVGPTGTTVNIIGENFTVQAGKVTFAGANNARVEATVDPAKWQAGEIQVAVPSAGVTGPVKVEVNAQSSNGVNFDVRNCNEDPTICGANEICCASGMCSVNGTCPTAATSGEYAWRTSTGIIPVNPEVVEECNDTKPPSPSPWDQRSGGTKACLNSDVVIRFNTKLDPKSVTPSTVQVKACTATTGDPCSKTTTINGRIGYPEVDAADTNTDYILFRPALQNNMWVVSTTYQVVLTVGIKSDSGVPMREKPECGNGNGYCFRFTTQQTGDVCKVGSVSVAPNPFTARALNQTIPYHASPRAAGDICIELDGSSMDWAWDTGGDGRASITNDKNQQPPGNVLDVQTGTALAETGDNPVHVNATYAGQGEPVKGTGLLSVNFVPPQVDDHGPGCDAACLNAAIWARFNVAMLPASLNADTIVLKRCTNENCHAFDATFDLHGSPIHLTAAPNAGPNAPLTYLTVEPTHVVNNLPTTYLEAGRFYKVIILGGNNGVQSASHLSLAGLNDPDGFAWTFRVKQGADARCGANEVDVTPGEKLESVVGARQVFVALPIGSPDACNKAGEPLINDQTYQWSSSDQQVSRFLNGTGAGLIDTTPELAPHCSGSCLNTGSDGVANMVASCGNGIIETTDPAYCQNGKTPFGDACTLLPKGAKGGEECDLGLGKNGPNSTCSNQCLWNPVRSVTDGGSCGNGTIDKGEQCDAGRACVGGPNPGRDCTTDANVCGQGGTCSVVERLGCSTQCQALGSRAAGSVCGNGAIGDGETCDDGNTASGDGCSSDCLHEGSSFVTSICGNGILEPGESCEATVVNGKSVFPAGCDSRTCLHTGTDACTNGNLGGCCGNGKVDSGEDCDDGNHVNGDGCSSRCLAEGSSAAYVKPSFCGDGLVGIGEMCEATKGGDGLIDPTQLAEIVGTAQPDNQGLMTSKLTATYDTKNGQATYGLQCGFKDEQSCPNNYGLTNGGCCSARPVLSANYPPSNATGVCRNVLVSGSFAMPMDPTSLSDNFIIAQEYPKDCPVGTTVLAPLAQAAWRNQVATWWHHLLAFFGKTANASVWCVGAVHGSVQVVPDGNGSRAVFTLDKSLEANTNYRVIFRGDPDVLQGKKRGIRTKQGVAAQADPIDATTGKLTWSFKTGNDICSINAITVQDTTTDHPGLFITANETHGYQAMAQAMQNGQAIPLSGTAEYAWTWQPWVSSEPTVFSANGTKDTPSLSMADVASKEKNGSSLIFASVVVQQDQINTSSTKGSVVEGSSLATAILCERPWPSRDLAPFTDSDQSKSLSTLAPAFANGPFYNFSTLYCMDAGKPGGQDDLPALHVQGVPLSAVDVSRGILRQYLFTYNDPALKNDGIGIRIVANPLHLSPMAWYLSRGFQGTPQTTQVDGYEAVRDGTTVYVAAANVDDSIDGGVTSTIYLISYNPNARDETVTIFNQLLANWTFNVNFQAGSENVCVSNNNQQYVQDGKSVPCTADWECARLDPTLTCASFKAKLQRDTKRIADFQAFSDTLETAKVRDGKYPLLSSGSYLQTISTSRWPSWSSALGAALGGQPPPTDPINRFLTCGRCSQSQTPCVDNSECNANETCVAQNQDKNVSGDVGYDPATCWDAIKRLYQCPALVVNQPSSVSRIYQYRSVDAGNRYELSTELEGPAASRYQPPLRDQIDHCSNTGQLCAKDADCTYYAPDQKTVISSGTCNPTGGSWRYQGLCTGQNYGTDDVCGNGVVGANEVCEAGQTSAVACTTADGKPGTKLQICSDCKKFVDGPNTTCVANIQCGNGRIDQGEACDDGSLNGTYGHCRKDCSGIGAFCGDNQISLGEVCDNGGQNGAYCDTQQGCNVGASCSADCRGVAPYCGDHVTQAPEECDGNAAQATGALCLGGANHDQPCNIDADCPGGTCGGDATHQSCVNVTAGRCAGGDNDGKSCPAQNGDASCPNGRCVQYPTQHVRTCTDPGLQNQCTWNAWSTCQPKGACGDGHVDPGEECDDGNNNNNDACTNQCKKNVCGDGFLQVGVEDCDYGNHNGDQCVSDYGSTCNSCSKQCRSVASSGGYCGDAIKNGPEQCDGKDGLSPDLTCRSLGYDYAEKTTCNQYSAYCVGKDGNLLAVYTGCNANAKNKVCMGDLYQICPGFGPSCAAAANTSCALLGGTLTAGQDNAVVNSNLYATCQTIIQTPDNISCTNTCSFTGCARCQDEPGNGVISGHVFDAIYSNVPVPNARVTLYLRGIKLGETFTDGDGAYSFNTLNARPECGFYRIVVDSYNDNPCTGTHPANQPTCGGQTWPDNLPPVDEGKNGGYWPFDSQTFNLQNFATTGLGNDKGDVYLIPKVGPDQTLVVFTWDGDISSRPIDMHLVLPQPISFAYCYTGNDAQCTNYPNSICSDPPPDQNGVCPIGQQSWRRFSYNQNNNIYWRTDVAADDLSLREVYQVGWLPFANLHCYSPSGQEVGGCQSSDLREQTMMFRRGDWALVGGYSLYLVDRNGNNNGQTSTQFLNGIGSTVRIVTQNQLYTVTPPAKADNACDETNDQYWLVFQQAAASGNITLNNSLLCKGASTPGLTAKLPQPLFWIQGGVNVYQ